MRFEITPSFAYSVAKIATVVIYNLKPMQRKTSLPQNAWFKVAYRIVGETL